MKVHTKLIKAFGALLAAALIFAVMPVEKVLADWSTFDNADYYYAAITNAPDGVYYRSAGFNPDGTKIVAQKQNGSQRELVLMDADGSNEVMISAGDSGTGDIYAYMNPFWSDDGTTIGYVEVHVSNPNKVIAYDVSAGTSSYIYEPTTSDVANPDFLGSSKTSIVFWAYGDVGGADLWTWDGTTLTNITDTDDYKEYEPVSNADGTKIVYWSGETTAEPTNTTHTLSLSGGSWVKDVGFTPIPDTYWSYWTTPAATQIATTRMASKDIEIYDATGSFVADLSGSGYSGGSGQWNFFGSMPQAPNGEYVITSNAARTLAGRDIVIANPRDVLYVATTGSDSNPGTEEAPFATIQKAIDEVAVDGTIYVAAGTYAERLNITKSLNLYGAQQGVDPRPGARGAESIITEAGLSTPNPDILIEIPAGVTDVVIDGFTLNGDQTNATADTSVLRIWDDNVTISNNIIDGYTGIINKGVDYLTVDKNIITANKTGMVSQPGSSTFVSVTDNVIQPGTSPASDAAGVYFTSSADCTVSGNDVQGFAGSRGIGGSNFTRFDITGNTFNNNNDGISIWGNSTFINVENNDISGNGERGINIKGADINIEGNTIENNADTGVVVNTHTITTERVRIYSNSITGNTNYGIQVDSSVTTTVDASVNWYGDATPAGVAAVLDGDVDYTPWLASGTDTSADPGFQGDFSTLWVDDDSPQSGTTGRIQEGVDSVSGSTVNVAPGLYTEDVDLDTSVTLQGPGVVEPFTDPVTTGDAQAPDTWYTDRYAPGVFEVVDFLGESVLKHGVREADSAANRPSGYSGAFYDTQGRKYDVDLTGPTQMMSIDMYVGEDWDTETRYSGLWATGFDSSDSVSAYPILAWRNAKGDGPGFFAYDYYLGSWIKLRDAVPADYGKWHTFAFELTVGTGVEYFVDGESYLTFADTDTVSLGNVILQVKNYGEDYDVYWDNFAVWDAKIVGQMDIDASNVAVDGLYLSNPGAQYGMQIDALADTVDITNNLFADIGSESLSANVKGIYLVHGSDNVTIENNLFERIHANAKSVNAIFSGDSNTTDPAEGLVIQDNRFLNITSQTKGGYGVLLNNGAYVTGGGNPGAIIDGNRFSGISGGWTHAVGMEGPTQDAEVTDNTFYNLTAGGADNSAVFFEANPTGDTVDVSGNRFQHVGYGVALHPNDLPGGSNGLDYTVDATLNYWGSACGPSPAAANVGPNVTYSPWYTDVTLTSTASGAYGEYIFFSNGVTTDLMNELIACAEPGSVLIFEDDTYTYPGGLVVGAGKTDLTFELNGVTVGPGSPAFTINGDDITINGPGVLDGSGSSDPGILVNDGADNFILDGVYIEDWADGVSVNGAHDSFKMVNNWLHDNSGAGLYTASDLSFATGSVVTIEGNLFKENDGDGIDNDSTATTVPAEYNSWGDIGGPSTGDGVSGLVDSDPFTYSEVFVDMAPDALATSIGLYEDETFNVAVKVDAVNLYAVEYELSYDTDYLTLQSVTDGSFRGSGICTTDTSTAGVISVFCTRFNPDSEVNNVNGETISTISFKATVDGDTTPGPFDTYLDLSTDEDDLSSGAVDGVKVFVNNGGFGAPSTKAGHTITDTDDGKVTITGLANFTGYIDLQGRANDSGAVLSVFDVASVSSGVEYASGTSASSGKVTTAFTSPYYLVIGDTYYFQADAYLFLPTTPLSAVSYENGDVLDTRSLTLLGTLELLGGDATNDDDIQITDLSCIGGDYDVGPGLCGTDGSSDVNGDGVIDIYDLVLSGGNYDKDESDWSQTP